MTREQAIKELTELLPEEFLMEYSEAIRMAIKALEQEPCENVPDLYECPCGYGWDKNKVVRHHFCPNCGRAVDGSIKTEQEPCEDCIRRSDIGLTDFEIVMCNGDYKEALKMLLDKIEKVPSVTPQPKIGSSSEKPNKWIPVSERLPEEAGMYLCSYDDDDVGTSYFDISMNEFNMLHEQVTAWMELPPSYQGE